MDFVASDKGHTYHFKAFDIHFFPEKKNLKNSLFSLFRCDQNYDCDDSSDEKDCKDYDKDTKCHQNQFLCLDGKCIDSNSLCDGFLVRK